MKTLDQYSGPWTETEAAHLLRRTTFGANLPEIRQVQNWGLVASVEHLLADQPLPAPPVNFSDEADSVPIGITWVDTPMPRESRFQRRKSLSAWTVMQQIQESLSIREKMTLFWHNHFAIETPDVNDARYLYQYQDLLRRSALGNFKQLVKEITINPAMLRYLDGRRNTVGRPNENYARELLELFTIGKGPQIGPGDYSNYTESDIQAIAKILTGWLDLGYNSDEIGRPISEFRIGRHDRSDKQLSYHFDAFTFSDTGDQEYSQLIDLIFTRAEVARFICRKLYRWLVNFELNEEIEEQIIQPMADLLIESGFEVKPVLRRLLLSQHFFDKAICGAIIRNPMEYAISFMRQGLIDTYPDNLPRYYNGHYRLYRMLQESEMAYFYPPDVAGWPAFYQEPVFYQSWITTATLTPRTDFVNGITSERGWTGFRYKIDVFGMLEQMQLAADPNHMIAQFARLFHPFPLTENQVAYLKEILIPGLPDFEWTLEYNNYLDNPEDEEIKQSVETRLLAMLQALLNMPETHLS